MSNTFEVYIDCYHAALEQAKAEIEEALRQGLTEDEVIDDGTYSFDAEFSDHTGGGDVFFTVTVTGPNAARIAQLVNELREPCPPGPEYGPPVDAITCLMTSPRFQDMTVREAIAELKANGLLP